MSESNPTAEPVKSRWRIALVVGVCLFMLVPFRMADLWLAEGKRPRLNYLYLLRKRIEAKPNAEIAILGQSTIGQWLHDGNRLARMLKVPADKVIGGNIGGCDYTCTYAEVRRLLSEGRHYKEIYFGANLYQMCEGEQSWRVLYPLALIPLADVPDLLGIWSHAQQPLRYYGRALGMTVSEAYRDSLSVRRRLRSELNLREPLSPQNSMGWVRRMKRGDRKDWAPICSYSKEEVAMKTAVVERLVPDMARLADKVYYLALPDRARKDPGNRKAWRKFLAQQRAIVSKSPNAVFLDLSTGGATGKPDFRDGAHLNGRGAHKQTQLLKKKLDELNEATKP